MGKQIYTPHKIATSRAIVDQTKELQIIAQRFVMHI